MDTTELIYFLFYRDYFHTLLGYSTNSISGVQFQPFV